GIASGKAKGSLAFAGRRERCRPAGGINSLYFPCITGNSSLETGSLETGPSATQSVSPGNRAGDPANAPLSAARWLMNRTGDSQGLWCRAKKRGYSLLGPGLVRFGCQNQSPAQSVRPPAARAAPPIRAADRVHS